MGVSMGRLIGGLIWWWIGCWLFLWGLLGPASAVVAPSWRGLSSPVPMRAFSPPSMSVLGELKDNAKQSWDETIADLSVYRERLPLALRNSIAAGCKSFINTCSVLFPVAFVLCIRPSYPDWKAIVKNGFVTGVQWSALSGAFVAGETLLERLRDKKDRINSCFGSGLSGAVANYRQGPWGMSKAFASGVAFFYVIDKFVGGKDPFLAVTSSPSSSVSLHPSAKGPNKPPLLSNDQTQSAKKLSSSTNKPSVGVEASRSKQDTYTDN